MARTDRTPRRRLDADVRREAILAAAADAFRSAPYAGVKVSDIATAAEASPALVYRYYGSKPGLYAAVLERAADDLAERQSEALEALPDGVPVRDRVRTLLEAHLDDIAANPTSFTNPFIAGDEPAEALAVRAEERDRAIAQLREVLNLTEGWGRHEMALRGYMGFVERAALAWAEDGCADDRRWAVVESSLGALQGALGDWNA